MTEQGLFGDLPPIVHQPKLYKSERMWQMYGKRSDKICGTCGYLIRRGPEHDPEVYFKCERYGISSSVATDWRKKWIACGLWKETK